MGFSKDEDGGETNGLSVVGGSQSGASGAGEGADKATVQKLAQLRQEHRDLDEAIDALVAGGAYDQLQLTRLKKRKLLLRDQISRLEDEILPDIIA